MTEDQGSPQSSRRSQDRRTILKGAKVVFNNGKGVMVCRVRDLSQGGARLEFPPRQALPDKFELHVAGQPVRLCERRWTRNNIVGVRFVGPDS
ncbi:PilZ domain-containing protein [Dongia deserti]|uniref:PilZ domain-containing protein n=1 Tax=Dongia deserti TaxID=2268030 RepID=UPI0013C3F6A2|nr:PilZ domain-containing protein [Dongia deserti]